MLRTDFLIAKCTKKGAPLPNILQIDFENDNLYTIEWKDEKVTSDLLFKMPCDFDEMDCRDKKDTLLEIVDLYESKNKFLVARNTIIKINV